MLHEDFQSVFFELAIFQSVTFLPCEMISY